MIELKGQQAQAFDAAMQWFNTPAKQRKQCFVIYGGAGTGKAQPLTAKIVTPRGWIRMAEVAVGAKVIGSNGKPVTVTGVFPQGVRTTYKVSFRDGSSTVVDGEHLWKVLSASGKSSAVMTTLDLLRKGVKSAGKCKWKIPLTEPVQFEESTPVVDPYVLGVLIGDAALSGSVVDLCAPDDELVSEVSERLGQGFELKKRLCGSVPHYTIKDVESAGNFNRLRRHLDAEGLCVTSKHKFIPEVYKRFSVEDRKLLLQGLMDTDGCCTRNRTRFSTSSKKLAEDITELVQSLGGTAITTVSSRNASEYNVNVKVNFNPFRLSRKAKAWAPSWKNPPSRYITEIVENGAEECQCISVDAEDSLYLTDEYIVTHNTTLAKKFREFAKCHFMTLSGKAALVMRSKGCDGATTVHSAIYRLADPDSPDPDFILNLDSETLKGVDLIILDELGMIDVELGADIMRFGIPVLAMGDLNQLPPPSDRKPYFDGTSPDFVLTEILRQAKDSPIIELAYQALNGGKLVPGTYGESRVYGSSIKDSKVREIMLAADQVLCGKNATRVYNAQLMRKWKGLAGEQAAALPTVGERLVCLRNNRDKGILNGEQFKLVELLDRDLGKVVAFKAVSLDSGSDREIELEVPWNWWLGTEDQMPPYMKKDFDCFYYADVMTVHKYQGSQADHICILDESGVFKENRRKHLYTAITRAAVKVDILL